MSDHTCSLDEATREIYLYKKDFRRCQTCHIINQHQHSKAAGTVLKYYYALYLSF